MATSKKTVAKASKKTVAPKKAANAKNSKTVKPVAKKAVAAKKTAPAKAAKKVEVVKKKKVTTNSKATSKTTKTVVLKKALKAPVKKTAPKKAAAKTPAKKVVKPAVPVKKAASKPVAKAPDKKVVSSKTQKPAPKVDVKKAVSKPAEKASKASVSTKKSVSAKKKVVKTITQNATITPSRPLPSSVSRVVREEKKPNVIVAHRKLENKSRKAEIEENLRSPNYQPEYKSILDEPIQESGPVYRYSDEELNEFKEIILSRMEAARKELAYLQGLITRKDEAGTEDTENRYMNMEDGSGAMEREQLAQLASRQIQFIGHLEKALMRIENKTYGVCRVTGKLIDKARLRAVPHATLSIEAKKEMSK